MADTKSSNPRIPPQNLDAEKALLGSIMLRPNGLSEVLDTITEAVFYSGRHRLIWKAMVELGTKNIPIDLLSLSSRLTEKSELEGKWKKKYEKVGKTPYQRVLEHQGITPEVKEKLRLKHAKLNPAVMRKEIERLKAVLYDVQRKHGSQGVSKS